MKKRLWLLPPAAALLWLFAWPVPVEPAAWTAPPPPALEGDYALNDRLSNLSRIGAGGLPGPEDVVLDALGQPVTGLVDGRVMRVEPDGALQELVNTGGRPLGLHFLPDGRLAIADADKGLLALDSTGDLEVLATGLGDRPFHFVDELDVAADGSVYFTDASDRFGFHDYMLDILEHRPNGRLLRWRPDTGAVELVLDGLYFANGVAIDPQQRFLLVNETSMARIQRLWLTGPKAGQSEVFIDDLPGYPDNLSVGEDGLFWLAMASPRKRSTEQVMEHPWLVQLVTRLPRFMMPAPTRHGLVLALDEHGRVVHNLQDPGGGYAPITSALQRGDELLLGSLGEADIGVVTWR